MPLGRICISHEKQTLVITAGHGFESRLHISLLGPSQQSVLMVLLE